MRVHSRNDVIFNGITIFTRTINATLPVKIMQRWGVVRHDLNCGVNKLLKKPLTHANFSALREGELRDSSVRRQEGRVTSSLPGFEKFGNSERFVAHRPTVRTECGQGS